MRHPFKSQNGNLCAVCQRDYLSHTVLALCEACDNKGECDLVESMLLCASCEAAHILARANQVNESIGIIDNTLSTQPYDTDTPEALLNKAREIDSRMRYNGDFFNAETISHIDLKKAIDANPSIPSDQKALEYQKMLMSRFEQFQQVIFDCDNEKFQALQRLSGIKKSLREFGNDLQKDIQKKLAESDAHYIPAPIVKAKVKGPSKKEKPSVYESLIKGIMDAKGCTREQALQVMIEKNIHNLS